MRTYLKDIADVAKKYGFDPLLIEAIVQQESGGNTDAFRFEPKFYSRYLKVAPNWKWARDAYGNPRRISSSYGLMQVLWVTAMERGYDRQQSPEMLFIPTVGLEWGCRHLGWLRTKQEEAGKGLPPETVRLAVLAAYNGGLGGNSPGSQLRNGKYAREVEARYQALLGSTTPR